MPELVLVRHTSVGVHPATVYGRTDVAVAGTFEAEADAVRDCLAVIWPGGPTRIVSSPAQRCQLLAARIGVIDSLDERLWEMCFGSWELQRWDRLPPSELAEWGRDFVHVHPPGGESYAELALRTHEALRDTLTDAGGSDRILVVAHGGVIRAALARFLEIPLRRSFDVQIDFGSITLIGWRGDRPHLRLINHR